MVDFENSLNSAFNTLSQANSISWLNETDIKVLGYVANKVWEFETEVPDGKGFQIPVILHITFDSDFPLSLPKVYLTPECYDQIKYIPHLDSDRLLCTVDSNIVRPNPQDPTSVIQSIVNKAKSIIEKEIVRKESIEVNDTYNEEFVAYWNCSFGKSGAVNKEIISLVHIIRANTRLYLIQLSDSMQGFKMVLHNNNKSANAFKKYLNDYNLEFKESEVFNIGAITGLDSPPYDITNKYVVEQVKKKGIEKEFKTFINKADPRLVIGYKTMGASQIIIGWAHTEFISERDGFPIGSITPYQSISTFTSSKSVVRVSPQEMTPQRLQKRTAGNTNFHSYKFLVAGLGSIGSNLIHLLNSFNTPEFTLVDEDLLQVENIERHFLGFNYVGNPKTKAMADYLRKSMPLQNVATREKSIVQIAREEPELLNNSDYIFSATGITNVDNWLAESMNNGEITKPIFFIWVEPYLAGGHCLYIHPQGKLYSDFFDETNGVQIYKYNIIHPDTHVSDNSTLFIKEAGCQTTYVPYPNSGVIGFLSALYPHLCDIMRNGDPKSKAITWIGQTEQLVKNGIKQSSFAQLVNNNIIVNE